LGSVVTAGTSSNQAESNYIDYATGTTSGNTNGIGSGTTAASCVNNGCTTTQLPTVTETGWLPKLVTRIRVPATISSTRDWVALTSGDLTGVDSSTSISYIGLRYSTGASDTAWQCATGSGSAQSVTSTGVTVTASHYYDIIIDLSTSGTLVCSVADNGGAYTTVTKTTNLPSTTTTNLALQETVTTLTTAARHLLVSYTYLEFQ